MDTNNLIGITDISPATLALLSKLVDLSEDDLAAHLDLTIAMLLAYEGIDISTETQAIAAAVSSIQAKISAVATTPMIGHRGNTLHPQKCRSFGPSKFI